MKCKDTPLTCEFCEKSFTTRKLNKNYTPKYCSRRCLGKSTAKENGVAAFNLLYRTYKIGAKRRSLSFELNKNDFFNLVISNCTYCNIAPNKSILIPQGKVGLKFNGDFIYNGIDRVYNNIGYVIDNCVPCCEICNRAKSSLDQSVFLEWIETLKALA